MNLEDEKDWSHNSGIVAATDRAVGMIRHRAQQAFLSSRDDEAKSLRELAADIEAGAKHACTKVDIYIARAKQEGAERTARRRAR